MVTTRWARLLVGAASTLTTLALLAGCGSDHPDATPDGATAPLTDWPVAQAPLPTGFTWSDGATVHLADGGTLPAPTRGDWVVAGDHVLLADADQRLVAVDRDGRRLDLGITAHQLRASPDGRYLAVQTGGNPEGGGTQPELVIVDLTTGEETVRATDVLGDPDDDELAEAPTTLETMTDDVLVLRGADGTWHVDLDDGTITAAADQPADQFRSPSGTWQLGTSTQEPAAATDADGRVVPLVADGPWVVARGWIDEDTTLGWAFGEPGVTAAAPPAPLEPDGPTTRAVTTCEVPAGTCTVHEETRGRDDRDLFLPAGYPPVLYWTCSECRAG